MARSDRSEFQPSWFMKRERSIESRSSTSPVEDLLDLRALVNLRVDLLQAVVDIESTG